jgi:hypothetical protein
MRFLLYNLPELLKERGKIATNIQKVILILRKFKKLSPL